jgi:endonuclease/exonuclease/phosphatase family metal-dependent hydrolase
MGWSRYRVHVLTTLALAGCHGIDDVPTPQWVHAETLGAEIAEPPSAVALQPVLRVVTWNTLFGMDIESVDVPIVAGQIVGHADIAQADVIALQENIRPTGAPASDAAALAGMLNMGHVFIPLNERDEGTEGVSLLSRFPLRDVEVLQLADYTDSSFLDAEASRVALAAIVDTSAGPIRIINIHLQVVLNPPERILQLRPAVINPDMPTVVLGDFNTNDYVWAAEHVPLIPLDATAKTSQARVIDSYMRNVDYDTPTVDFGGTWSGFPEDQRLDSIYTHDLIIGTGGVDRTLDFSDHWPVFLDVGL